MREIAFYAKESRTLHEGPKLLMWYDQALTRRDRERAMDPRVFLSFAMEDKPLVELFRGQARNRRCALTFRDYSIKEPVDGIWKYHAERLIRASTATLCLVGTSTWRSEPVDWEIRRSAQLDKRVLAVFLRAATVRVPSALHEIGVTPISWSVSAIERKLHGE